MKETEEHPTSLLLPFVKGELNEDKAGTVQDHLDECAECADEVRGIRLLLEEGADELADLERARLHHAVIAATVEPRTVHGGPLTRRLAPYLGTAAVLALLAVGIMVVNPLGGDDADSPITTFKSESDPPGAETAQTGGDERAGAGEGELFQEGAASQDAARNTALAAGPSPLFDLTTGRMTADDLDRLGRSSDPFRAFANAYRVDAAPALQASALEQLIQGLPARDAELVRACTRAVLRNRTDAPIPVYGGYGSLDGEEVLLLGFTWTPGTSGPLDRFMVWAWPRGSCESPLVYRWGWIDR